MKISLITMHAVYNYGSALQTYATVNYLKELGHNVEIVDYYPKRMRNYGSISQIYRDALPFHSKWKCALIALLKYPSMISLKSVFAPFTKKYFCLSNRYESNEDLVSAPPKADCYITGSDQVWNDYLEGEFDLSYFLNFAPRDSLRIALAASFGRDDVNSNELLCVKSLLELYSAITVREESGLKILSDIKVPVKECVLDPTFFLNNDSWIRFSKPINMKGYILVYQLHEDSITSDVALYLGKQMNKQVIRISTDRLKRIKGGKTVYFPAVEEFVSYINNADLIVTDSFHATAFSINLQKQFISIRWKMFNDRIATILKTTNLITRMVSSIDEAFKLLDKPIDYTYVNSLIKTERIRSCKLINEVLETGFKYVEN